MKSINPVIQHYMECWKKGDESEILDALTEDCIIIESHGPTYCGKKIVKKWIKDWYGQGNVVETWNITSSHTCGDLIVCEWIFAYKGREIREAFEGVSLVKIKDNKISELREYRATQFPFMWNLQEVQ